MQTGRELAGQLIDAGLAPTAIFAANNAIALGAVEAAGARGLRIPADMALVCFDDYPYVASFFPFLTIIAQPAYDMGSAAAQLLLDRLESSVPLEPRHLVLPVQLVIRLSCGSSIGSGGSAHLNLPLQGVAGSRVAPVSPIGTGAVLAGAL